MKIHNEAIRNFDWKDLHGKIVRLAVAEPNVETLEFVGQVYAMDEHGNIYVLHEWVDEGIKRTARKLIEAKP